jgi:hypothetical protein
VAGGRWPVAGSRRATELKKAERDNWLDTKKLHTNSCQTQ